MPGGEAKRRGKKRKNTKKAEEKDEAATFVKLDSASLDKLPWNASFPADDEDPFAALASGGSEGGFLSLEEIDEAEYGFIGESQGLTADDIPSGTKKRKRGKDGDKEGSFAANVDGEGHKAKKKKKKLKSKRTKGMEKEIIIDPENVEEVVPGGADALKDSDENDAMDNNLVLSEDEVSGWKSLRLNEMLMKAICFLGFREPTPIQKACIPAAAHQGKDVIGSAETGSGKTLAFGLPILQRLLEEREKESGMFMEEVKIDAKVDNGSPLRALIVTPTRELALQVSDHLKAAAKFTGIHVVPIVGGMSKEKQERLLRKHPEIIVGTPGRLWELMSEGESHLTELHSLSFFVLDEADRMIENGHFHELNSIIDLLPQVNGILDGSSQTCKTIPNVQLKKRQTFVFSATIALSDGFRKKLKHGFFASKSAMKVGPNSIENLSERAGIRADVAIVDLTNSSILASKLEESFIECNEEDKDAYLYYILSVHGHGRTIVFCTSIAALRRISSLLRILGVEAWTLHAQMQQRARLKNIDRFRGNDNTVLIATDVAARGLDVPGVRTVVHYQLPHSADVYIHRSGRTARASEDGCSIALISPSDKVKFSSLCKSLSKESLKCFPLNESYMPEVTKRLSLANQIDKISRKNAQEIAKKSWFDRAAESVELAVEDSASEEEIVKGQKQKKTGFQHLENLRQELNRHLTKPLQPKTLSHRYLAGAGLSPVLHKQLEEFSKKKMSEVKSANIKKPKLIVIGHDCMEPIQALRNSGHQVCVNADKIRERKRFAEARKRKERKEKRSMREKRSKRYRIRGADQGE